MWSMSNATVRVESSLCEKISFHGWKCLTLYFGWKWLSFFPFSLWVKESKRNGDGNDELFPLFLSLSLFPPPADFLTGLIRNPISPSCYHFGIFLNEPVKLLRGVRLISFLLLPPPPPIITLLFSYASHATSFFRSLLADKTLPFRSSFVN